MNFDAFLKTPAGTKLIATLHDFRSGGRWCRWSVRSTRTASRGGMSVMLGKLSGWPARGSRMTREARMRSVNVSGEAAVSRRLHRFVRQSFQSCLT